MGLVPSSAISIWQDFVPKLLRNSLFLVRLSILILISKSAVAVAAQDDCSKPIKFPDMGLMMAQQLGIERPQRKPKEPLPPFDSRATSLPRGVVFFLVYKMGTQQNFKDVAYAASGHRTIQDKLYASWARDDLADELREYFSELNPTQRQIMDAAFAGGMADIPPSDRIPEIITLSWVEREFPARKKY
jgi:hypothetical protein